MSFVRKSSFQKIRLGLQHQSWLYVCFGVLLVTGALWLGFHYFGRMATAIGDTPHPAEAWWMRIHGFAAMLALILFGSLMPVHIRKAWHLRKSRRSGGVLAGALAILALTGYALYYLVNEDLRGWASVAHWAIGLALVPASLVHILVGRETRSTRPPDVRAPHRIGRHHGMK